MRLRPFPFLLLSVLCCAQNVSNDSGGFEQQYRAVFDAAKSGNQEHVKHALDSFALPDSWFQQVFGSTAEQWMQQYKTEFQYFEYAESRRLQSEFKDSTSFGEVRILAPRATLNPPAKPAPSSEQPLPAMEEVQIKAPSSGRSWATTFVYVNGGFRFFGGGGYPFWDPRRIHPPDMCDPEGHQSGGQLAAPVNPIYPEEAQRRGVQGNVRLLVHVGKDGSVSSVDLMNGDPRLAESATVAAKQWRYRPFVNCGQPIDAQSVENVRYSLDGSNASVTIIPLINTPPGRVRISSGVSAGNLLHKVDPIYPADARHKGVQGTVLLKIVIDKNGNPQDVTLVVGPPELADAAIHAVRQWQYKPYILNGEPIEAETVVQIRFTLNR